MDSGAILDLVRAAIGGLIIAGGLLLIAGGSLGMLRFPDLYTRAHASSAADSVGAVCVIAGLAVAAPNAGTMLRLVLLGVLLAAVSPLLTQLVTGAAHAAGLAPIAGPHTAPRPGQPSTRRDAP